MTNAHQTTIVGRLTTADGFGDPGSVLLHPVAAAIETESPALVTTASVYVETDDQGAFTITVEASDSPDWRTLPVPYVLIIRTTSGYRGSWTVLVPSSATDVPLTDLLPLNAPPASP